MIKEYINFLSQEECDYLIIHAESFNVSTTRINEHSDNIIQDIIKRVDGQLKLKTDISHLIYYDIGDKLGRHKDLSGPFAKRVLSVVIYLNDVGVGGETRIYKGEEIVDIIPEIGKMVVYDSSLEHEGLPPVSNKKYIMTCWLV